MNWPFNTRSISGTIGCILLTGLLVAPLGSILARVDSSQVHLALTAAEIDSATLVWGVNGWRIPSRPLRPAGSVLVENVLRTDFVRQRDSFVLDLRLPAGTILNWGMLIRSGRRLAYVEQPDTTLVRPDNALRPRGADRIPFDPAWESWILAVLFAVLALVAGLRPRRYHVEVSLAMARRMVAISSGSAAAVVGMSAWFIHYFYAILRGQWLEGPEVKTVFIIFSAARENTVGTWVASMLFLAAGLLVGVRWLSEVRPHSSGLTHRATRHGWLLVALAFIGLSADEMGSVHERFDPGALLELGLIRMVAAAASLYLLAFFIVRVRSDWRAFAALGAGAALIGAVLVFEHSWEDRMVENPLTAAERWRTITFSVLEEGVELAASCCFVLGGVLGLRRAAAELQEGPGRFTVEGLAALAWLGVAVSFVGVAIVAPRVEGLIGDDGLLRNWFPAALAFAAATVVWLGYRPSGRANSLPRWVLIVALLGLSAYHGGNLQFWLSRFPDTAPYALWMYRGTVLLAALLFAAIGGARELSFARRLSYLTGWGLVGLSWYYGGGAAEWYDVMPFALLYPALTGLSRLGEAARPR